MASIFELWSFAPVAVLVSCLGLAAYIFGLILIGQATSLCRRAEAAARESSRNLRINSDNHLIFLGEMARRQGWDLRATAAKTKLPPTDIN